MEHNLEIAIIIPEFFVYMLVLTYFKGCVGALGSSPLERNVCGTHVIVSLLKAWNMTVVWIVCGDAFFNAVSKRYTS